MKTYHEILIAALKDPAQAASYLNVVLEEKDPKMFLVALRNVAEARGGLSKLSRQTRLNRANLYRVFSKTGNPEIQTLSHILDTLGLRLAVETKSHHALKAA